VLDDVGVSRHHAHIRPTAEGWTVEDLGSTNGVLVNGSGIRGVQLLHPGDRVLLGSTEMIFELR
jgi:pSer/pThr/pTyr-binding forkhead associated (FHA) protein